MPLCAAMYDAAKGKASLEICASLHSLTRFPHGDGFRVGDIGPKIGFNAMDNGFCAFDRVRIPRGNMAMRHQQVSRSGVYTSTGSKEGSKIAYISMMQASALIVYSSFCFFRCNQACPGGLVV